MGTNGIVYDGRRLGPFASLVSIVVSVAVVIAVQGWNAAGVLLWAIVGLATLVWTVPVRVQVDSERVRVRYVLRTVVVPREKAVVTWIERSWWRPDRTGWFIIDRRSSFHRYPIHDAPVETLARCGYLLREGEPADWGHRPSPYTEP